MFTAIILFIISMVLGFPFPHDGPFGETIASALHLPIQSDFGLQYVGIASLALFGSSLIFLFNSVEKFNWRLVLLAIILASTAPPTIISAFQKMIATGVYAVSYKSDSSNCQFEMINTKTLHGKCELPFENYSNNEVQFTIEFYEEYFFEDDGYKTVSLMNESTPYLVSLKGKERKTVTIEKNIDVSKMDKHIHGASSIGVGIKDFIPLTV